MRKTGERSGNCGGRKLHLENLTIKTGGETPIALDNLGRVKVVGPDGFWMKEAQGRLTRCGDQIFVPKSVVKLRKKHGQKAAFLEGWCLQMTQQWQWDQKRIQTKDIEVQFQRRGTKKEKRHGGWVKKKQVPGEMDGCQTKCECTCWEGNGNRRTESGVDGKTNWEWGGWED